MANSFGDVEAQYQRFIEYAKVPDHPEVRRLFLASLSFWLIEGGGR